MGISSGVLVNGIEVFLLVFIRMAGLFVVAPIFGRSNIPVNFKVGFSLLMALILVNTLSLPSINYFDNIYKYAYLIFIEFIVGVLIGYVSYLIFQGIYIAGQLIDMQIGFGVVNVIDPMSNIQVPMTSNFYVIVSTLVLLSINGHHALIRALFESYKYIPPGGAVFSTDALDSILRMFNNIFVVGFKVAAPILAAILICDIALGVISRAVPQLNVFVVGMPLKVFLGIALLILTIPMFISVVKYLAGDINNEMLKIIKDISVKP